MMTRIGRRCLELPDEDASDLVEGRQIVNVAGEGGDVDAQGRIGETAKRLVERTKPTFVELGLTQLVAQGRQEAHRRGGSEGEAGAGDGRGDVGQIGRAHV